ncbi:TOBE domain-containing protein [Undibacterium sp. Ji67W]|uniref:TOBE domain-containing protein n=1 Tax=Undibacterium sp. Ji67W TaxID=3413042 RepID=UPI003BF1065E
MNFIPATLNGSGILLQSEIVLHHIRNIPIPQVASDMRFGRAFTFDIRPESIQLCWQDQDDSIEVLVQLIEHTGSDAYFRFQINNVSCMARCEPHKTPQPGDIVRIRIDTSKAILFDPLSGDAICHFS